MATTTTPINASAPGVRPRFLPKEILRLLGAVACWAALLLEALATTLGLGQNLLGLVLLGRLPCPAPGTFAPPWLPNLVGFVVTAGLAWVTARYVASRRRVGWVIGTIVALVAIVEVTWALSAPDQALYYARDTVFGQTNVGGTHDSQTFPQRAILNRPSAFQFAENASPQLFQTIHYRQGGQAKQANLDNFLAATQTTAFIVIKDGAILDESYANGYARDSINTSYSVAKSFTSALVGIAIGEGSIGSVNDPIVAYLPKLRGKGIDDVTIRDLLTMSAGLSIRHEAAQSTLANMLALSDDTRTTYFPNLRTVALSVRPGADAPGTAFEYDKRVPMLLGMILERTTHRSVSQYLQEKIWQPLGMEYSASWSLDSTQSGFERMESGLNARAIDFAKFGELYLNNGVWNDRQIVPAQWVSASTSPGPADTRPWRTSAPWKEANGYYGYLWWGRTLPDGSYAYQAWGDRGQFIYVSPKDRVVIVRNGILDGGIDSWPDVLQSITENLGK
jgi:CubicO group peptidase (beta-lactamase class C family)